jgi:hypothetical protein
LTGQSNFLNGAWKAHYIWYWYYLYIYMLLIDKNDININNIIRSSIIIMCIYIIILCIICIYYIILICILYHIMYNMCRYIYIYVYIYIIRITMGSTNKKVANCHWVTFDGWPKVCNHVYNILSLDMFDFV